MGALSPRHRLRVTGALAVPILLWTLTVPLALSEPAEPAICVAATAHAPGLRSLLEPAVYEHYTEATMAAVTGSAPDDLAFLHPVAATAFTEMRLAAETAGHRIDIWSAWRSWDTQLRAHRHFLRTGRNLAGTRVPYVAHPEESRHPAGLAVDIAVAPESPLHEWMADNAPCHGFVNTRPDEPWEWQYLGPPPGDGAFHHLPNAPAAA